MRLKYTQVVGVGGIGAGILFHSRQNSTLGRSESRLVVQSSARDYCKQHIVLHYPARLLAPHLQVVPIGCVGEDANGDRLIDEMRQAGMDTHCVQKHPALPTMLSICLQYPDKEGCNFTAVNSACDTLEPEQIPALLEQLQAGPGTIAAALPEVRAATRIALLEQAHRRGAYGILSVPEAEAADFWQARAYRFCSLLSVNEAEAAAICGAPQQNHGALALALWKKLSTQRPDIAVMVTCGPEGAYSVANGHLERIPPLAAEVVNTAGAGDAFLGGVIAGLALDMPLQKGRDDRRFGESPLASAAELGTLCAGMALESRDSIGWQVTADAITQRLTENRWEMAKWSTR